MKDIRYIGTEIFEISVSNHWLSNDCHYVIAESTHSPDPVKIGSVTCSACKFNVVTDRQKRIVICRARMKNQKRLGPR